MFEKLRERRRKYKEYMAKLDKEYDRHDTIVNKFGRERITRHEIIQFGILGAMVFILLLTVLGVVLVYAGSSTVLENIMENHLGIENTVIDEMFEAAYPGELATAFYIGIGAAALMGVLTIVLMVFAIRRYNKLERELEKMADKRKK